jgi:hypothetical protein
MPAKINGTLRNPVSGLPTEHQETRFLKETGFLAASLKILSTILTRFITSPNIDTSVAKCFFQVGLQSALKARR